MLLTLTLGDRRYTIIDSHLRDKIHKYNDNRGRLEGHYGFRDYLDSPNGIIISKI